MFNNMKRTRTRKNHEPIYIMADSGAWINGKIRQLRRYALKRWQK